MEPAVRALHTHEVKAAVAREVGVAVDSLRTLGGFESFVYETVVGDAPRIVKATWHGRRTVEQMGAELHFVNYLADGGAPVCRAHPLANGELIATVPASDSAFHVCAFEKAPGATLKGEQMTVVLAERWGALVGCLHRLSAAYPGPPAPLARPAWEEEYAEIERIIARGDPAIHARYREVVGAIAALPRERGTFGAMHTDLHYHNLFWHEGRPRAFDFDDMLDFWFVADLAIVFYYGVMAPVWHDDDRQADFDRLRAAVLRGYAREHELPRWSHDALPLFLSLREHTLRAVILRSIPESERTPWWARFVDEATARILEGRPPLDLVL